MRCLLESCHLRRSLDGTKRWGPRAACRAGNEGHRLAYTGVRVFIGLYIINELRDIKLCQFTANQHSTPETPLWSIACLWVLQMARQYGVCAFVIVDVYDLVLWRDSDALMICFRPRIPTAHQQEPLLGAIDKNIAPTKAYLTRRSAISHTNRNPAYQCSV